MNKIGIIGGSGLDDPKILHEVDDIEVDTPYGKPTSLLTLGHIGEIPIVLLARHGKYHTFPPTQVNFRANIYALREIGCTHIISTTACGSLREEIGRGDLVILDQFIDFTRRRELSFFEMFEPGPENAMHVAMPDPFNEYLRQKLIETARELNIRHHPTGTVISIEGPRFSTRAESKMFRIWGADVINMSVATEAALANETGIPYAAVAMSTDYDCWKTDEAPVDWSEILYVFSKNVENVKQLLIRTISKLKE